MYYNGRVIHVKLLLKIQVSYLPLIHDLLEKKMK